jgi:hypothetical protein
LVFEIRRKDLELGPLSVEMEGLRDGTWSELGSFIAELTDD